MRLCSVTCFLLGSTPDAAQVIPELCLSPSWHKAPGYQTSGYWVTQHLYTQYNECTLTNTGAFPHFPPHPQGHIVFPQNARNNPLSSPSGNQRLPGLQAASMDSSALPSIESPPFLEPVRRRPHFAMWASTFPRATAMLSFLGINSSSNKPISYSKRQFAPWTQTWELPPSSALAVIYPHAVTHPVALLQTVPLPYGSPSFSGT